MNHLTGSAEDGYRIDVDDHGIFDSFAIGPETLRLPLAFTHYEVNGQRVSLNKTVEGPIFELTDTQEGTLLPTRLRFDAARELTVRPESDPTASTDDVTNWSITLPLPLSAEIHIPEFPNIGRRLDRSIPTADFYGTRAFYNFVLVGCGGVWIRLLSEQRRVGRLGVHVERHDEMFLLTVTWYAGRDDAGGIDQHAFALDGRIALFGSMEEAMADYDRYLADEVGVKERACGNPLPEWINRTRLSVSIDLIRSYGEIVNRYADVAEIARALKREGAPSDTIVHIVGFNGAFDTTYPTHRPVDELGGAAGFRAMVDTIHECGFKFSVHVNGCCIDPHHKDIDELMPLVLRDSNGNLQGYKLSPDRNPPSRRIRFSTGQLPLQSRDATSASVSVTCPALCESMVTVGGIRPIADAQDSSGRVSITINGRTHKTPPGTDLGEYQIPYPMHLEIGPNSVEFSSDSKIDWTRAWFRVDLCFVPNFVHAIGTIPILMADTTNPNYISLFCDEMENLVAGYDVDLLYIDYTTFYHPNGSQKLFAALCERLPDTPFAVEWCDTLEELGWSAFCGGSRHHLVKASPKLQELSGRKYVPVSRGIIERYGWLDVTSPVCDFAKRYHRFRGGGAFVPLNWVASIYDDYLLYGDPTELREILDGAERLNFIPSLQLNYQRHGIDEHAKSFLHDMSAEKE